MSFRAVVQNLLNPVRVLAPKEAYRLWAPSYDDQGGNAVLYLEELSILPFLTAHVLPGTKVIDFGCGTGRHILHCQRLGATNIVGVDLSKEMLGVAKSKFDGSSVKLVQAKLEELPFIESSFDVGIMALVLSHINNLGEVIGSASRLLRSNGVLLVSDLHWSFNERGWLRTFHSASAPAKRYAAQNVQHLPADYARAFAKANLRVLSSTEPVVDERIRKFFENAGMMKVFDQSKGQPLLTLFELRKQ